MATLSLAVHAADATLTRTHRNDGVIMMIGGMGGGKGIAGMSGTNVTNGTNVTTPVRSVFAAADTSDRRSVVIQPGERPPASSAAEASGTATSRVMALLPIIADAAQAAEVDSALLMAVIDVESGGNPRAMSPKGATGLMQLMPATGARQGASDLLDPRQNIAVGARYLKALMRQFGDLPLALAAYNAGEGAVQKYGGQIPPYAETMTYVPKVMARYSWYRDATASTGTGTGTIRTVSSNARSEARVWRIAGGSGN